MADDGAPENWSKVTNLSKKTAGIDSSAITNLATQLSDGSTKADNLSAGFKALHGDLQSAWSEGSDADAVHNYVLSLSKAGGNVSDKLKSASKQIHSMGQALETVQKQVKEREQKAQHTISQNNSKLKSHVAQLQSKREAAQKAMDAAHGSGEPHTPKPGESPSDYDDKIQKAKQATKQANEKEADDAANDIQRLLDQADNTIDSAVSALDVNVPGGFREHQPPGQPGNTSGQAFSGDTGSADTGGTPVTSSSSGGDTGGSAAAVSTSSSSSGGSSSGSSSSSAGSSGAPPNTKVSGDVQQWINQAKEVLAKNGVKLTDADINAIKTIIQHESGGNPHAINNWDSNAAKGTPSKGLMQCIDPTFNQYKLPGHDDIYNPVDNICAGVKYSISRYGSMSSVPGVQGVSSGSGYVGY